MRKTTASVSGTASCHDNADAPAEAEQADEQHDAERHREFHHELADRCVDVDGLVADLGERHAERQGLGDRARSLFQRLAEFQPVPALLHHRREHDGWLALMADDVGRRILVAATDIGDVGELQRASAGDDRRVGDGLDAVIGAVETG